ncbi:protein kinase family protein [Clostridium tagluense]|uniref:protein kinase family protein n=1 Tax=Clostridium tagluense TaxID=360422 RepID=UPI001CF2219F|nr:protein kinase family protein [Clostridium tagluense]MCB2297948.1 protein kinase family protein [Clostridium tagluense]
MNIENYIESQYRNIDSNINEEYLELYEGVNHPKLKVIFSTLHSRFLELFKSMNSRLPTMSEYGDHFWADQSRELIEAIEIMRGMQRALKNTPLAFNPDEYYQGIIKECNKFLSGNGGSTLPPGMDKVELYYTIPIFILQNTITIVNSEYNKTFELKLIGEGSYAQIFKYKDEYYKKYFVLKRAKKDLNEKELARFKLEFEQMNTLNSPYIVEVFCYNDTTNEYIMEYMDFSLNDYITKNNTKLNVPQRKRLGFQILKAFAYIHSKELLHRDISPKNILIKCYDDVEVVKIADFGLVRIPDSNLTSVNTEFKGYLNDPSLVVDGFERYNILHETYALTRLLFFVMTGRTNIDKVSNIKLKEFVARGLNIDKSKRFLNVDELTEAFRQI